MEIIEGDLQKRTEHRAWEELPTQKNKTVITKYVPTELFLLR